MHLVQLSLQVVDLFLDRCLPVELLLVVFLCILRLLGNLRDLHELADRCGDHGIPRLPGICCKDIIFLFRVQVQIIGESAGKIVDILSLKDEAARPQPPLISLDETKERGSQLGKLLLCFLLCQVVSFRAEGNGGGQPAVLICQFYYVYTIERAHGNGILLAESVNTCRDPYGIKVFCRILPALLFLLQKNKEDIRTVFQFLCAEVRKEITFKIVRHIRQEKKIVNRSYDHDRLPPFSGFLKIRTG